MYKNYKQVDRSWRIFWVLVGLLLSSQWAAAQSGPVGNEWIVPGQQYYKVKILKDGLYKLDYQYLTQAGISGVVPSQLQVWRRGREIATYLGGNPNVLDPTTFLEFYAVHNDGKLDGELYKNRQDQPHTYYSFYTDTASYFITWSTARSGRRMAQPSAAGGAVHPHRLTSQVNLKVNFYLDDPMLKSVYLPWLEAGEGFFGGGTATVECDSVIRNVAATGPAPQVEVAMFGATGSVHDTEVLVVTPSGTRRSLGVIRWTGRSLGRRTFQLLRSDVDAAGKVKIVYQQDASGVPGDNYYACYIRIIAPQLNLWIPDRHSVTFQNDSLLTGPATYEFESSSIPATAVGFDVQDIYNVQRIVSTVGSSGTSRRFVFPDANANATHQLLLADEARPAVPSLPARRVYFRAINPAVPTFIIITHPKLMKRDPATGIVNAPKAYAAYRASAAGGRYDTLVVTAPQLYDQFTYGDRSWLALRHFSRWIVAAAPTATNRYLLLLGKGIVPSESGAFNRNNAEGVNLVPTSSRSVSDNMLTANIDNNDFVAKLHTGRLTATTPQQIISYLNKLTFHEALPAAPWRKNVLHLVGGYDAAETVTFRSYLDSAKARVERPFLGGRVATEFRVTPDKLPVSIDISAQLNAGLSLITYFGHGANNFFALNFGSPTTSPSYNNTGRYPFLFLYGCAANGTLTSVSTTVEQWLFADQKGALGSLGQSGFGFPYELSKAQAVLYKLLFNDPAWYGKPITVVNDELVRRLQGTPDFRSDIGIEQLLCTSWQGDPTLALFAPERPDFVANAASLSVSPALGQSGRVRAASTEFILNVGVSNPAKITYDPLEIKVTRRYSSGRPPQVYSIFTRRQAWAQDTTYALTLPNTPTEAGTSTFRVELDPSNRVVESSETNNTAEIDYTFLEGGLSVVNPTEFAIVNTVPHRLVVQNNDPNGAQRGYDFELDTVSTFNSSRLLRAPLITAGVAAEWQPVLPSVAPRDSVVWYWRARFHTPNPGEDGNWVTSSFRVIPSSPGGWSQSHYAQLQRTTRTGVDVSGPAGAWTFVPNRVPLVMRTRGGGVAVGSAPQFNSLTGAGIYIQSAGSPSSVSRCGITSPNLLVAVYEPSGLRPVAMPAAYQNCGQAPNKFYYFSAADQVSATDPAPDPLDNLNSSAARQQELANFLAAVPPGSYVALVSVNHLRYSLLPASLKATLQTLLGSQLINQLADGEPLALLGQKLTATTGRLVHEVGPNAALSTPGHDQIIELRDTLQQRSTAGRVVSPRIGPVGEWLSLYSTIRTANANGYHTLKVVAIDPQGTESVVFPNVTSSAQALSTIAASQYPYLRLELALGDSVTRIPPQLRQWLVTYRPLPEGVVRRDLVPAASYAPATLVQQATTTGNISFPVNFQNVSTAAFAAPLQARVNLRNAATNNVDYTTVISVPGALAAGATAVVPVSIDMIGRSGTFTIEVFVNPRLQPEQLYSNNELLLDAFTIIDNNLPPTLDVAFDGRHILNGELVSPTPVISIQLNDEDKLRHVTDASFFNVTLQRPGQAVPAAVNVTGADVNFSVDKTNGSVAKLEYRPGQSAPLADGMYTLRVQGRDPSNASAGSQEFQVKFEVVNASKITNLYPYPNPVINKARFVFTVTGQELPRNMKIQILTLTGRVVREIFMNELGPLHIGNNITDFAWDGTDTYGDRLANGTYLYRVALDDPGNQFSHRETAGDKAFKNDWGKLVLMR
ncbi:putative type IX secretion system sortase PorU2 [Hymenobacter terrenus]|uniref:putative type IX secretion system sortase PorU2 n=1 Tax=Hymenobacter terrenus TaxID=1629124 RepID=UPI0009E5CCE7|nr:C25 family cysteine peptidase [Hymenobacter terrenus]